ncbi:MAG: zinc-dependent metalloprotease, partial [Candidatus Kapabacteria bacterium]|nr:zinc-dependent metalloprotease [Candidatus Kapabacteria bacterium]
MRLVLILLVCLVAPIAYAQDVVELFTQTRWPSTFSGQHPASFFTINSEAFNKSLLLEDNKVITLSIDLPTFGTVDVAVARYRVIDQGTTITAMTANGPQQVPPPKSVLLRGRILTIPDSYVVLAVYEDWATGLITTGPLNGNRSYRISPLGTVLEPKTMVIYDAAKVPAINDWNCGTVDPVEIQVPSTKDNEETQAVTYRKVTISVECDEPYYIDHGRDITKATQYAEAIVAASSAVYERDVQATLVIGSLLVWTTVDPYTSNLPDEMLVQFRDRWRSINGSVVRSVAHLLSGTNNIGGVAYVDQLCSKQWGYAVSGTNNNVNYPAAGYVWDTDVFSHELGHNIGSPHTHACSWAPPIDSCFNAEGGCFAGTKPRKGTIMSYCHLTASGTDLSFHSRVVTLMQGKLNGSACTPLITIFEVTVPANVDVCAGNAASVTATVIGGTGRLSYRWRATGIDTVTQVATYQHIPTATKKLFITVTDSLGNTTNDSTLITVNAKPLAQLLTATPSVCKGTVVEITSVISGGRLPYTYRWFRNGIVIDTVADMVWPRIDSTSLVKLIVTDMNGCGDTADITITVPDNKLAIEPSRYVLPSLAVCEASVAANITLRNDGQETIFIDSVKAGTWLSVGTTLPIILAPASAQQIVLNVAFKKTGTVVDTVVFV